MRVRPVVVLSLLASSLLLGACGAAEEELPNELEAMPLDAELNAKADGPTDWVLSGTLHADEPTRSNISPAAMRRLYPFYVGASATKPVQVEVKATSAVTGMQIAVFGPRAADGTWPTAALAQAGYDKANKTPALTVTLKQAGLYRTVVSSYRRASEGMFDLVAACKTGCEQMDALLTPKAGALAPSRTLDVKVNPALGKVQVEAWTVKGTTRTKVAAAPVESGLARLALGTALVDGDDLQLVVPGIDEGVPVRLWTASKGGARLDKIAISDFGHFYWFSGATTYAAGTATLALQNETKRTRIGTSVVRAVLPGRARQGLGAYDAEVELPIMDSDPRVASAAQAKLPKSGHVLSVGALLPTSTGSTYQRFGCFRYCGMNDSACKPGPVSCP